MKKCNKCLLEKDESFFSKDKYKKDGLSTFCKVCKTNYFNSRRSYFLNKKKEYRADHVDEIRALKNEWNKRNAAHIVEYGKTYYIKNALILKKKKSIYYLKNTAFCINASKTYAKKHPQKCVAAVAKRRALKNNFKSEKITDKDIIAIKEQYNFCCAYCGIKETPMHTLHMDHIYPLSKGGGHLLLNLAPACGTCNNRKYNSLPLHWLKLCQMF